MLLFSNYYSIHVVFVLHQIPFLFAFETEDGCKVIQNMYYYFKLKTVCSDLKITSCLLLFRKFVRNVLFITSLTYF